MSLVGDDPTPWRHQVIEIPPLRPVVTEYQWHQLACPACGMVTRACAGRKVSSGTYGPRVQATVALCTGAYRLSKRMTQQMMDEVFGVPMSVGTIGHLEQVTPAADVDRPRRGSPGLRARSKRSPTSTRPAWRQGDKQAWLWVAVTTLGDRLCGPAVTRWPSRPRPAGARRLPASW